MAQLIAEVERRAPPVRRTLFWTLGLGAFGLAFSITTTAAYLPPLLARFTDSGTLIGLVLGAEGVFALALSPVIGPRSDTFHTPLGHGRVFEGVRAYLTRSWRILKEEREVRRFLLANAAWEGAFAAARTFVVLYVIEGLHESKAISSAILGAVATGYVIAAVVSGRLGDRFGLARVIFIASFVYGGGLIVAGLATTWQDWYFALIVPVAVAGGTVMTLAWGLLFKLMPPQHRGAISGLATTTKGLGLLLGAPVAGAAIDLARPWLDKTDGYQILWPVCAIPILAAIPLVYRMMAVEPTASLQVDGGGPPLP